MITPKGRAWQKLTRGDDGAAGHGTPGGGRPFPMTLGFKVTLFPGLHAKTKEEREVGLAEFAALIQITRVLGQG